MADAKGMLLGRVLPLEPTGWGIPAALLGVLLLSAILAVTFLPQGVRANRTAALPD